ncbi:MAG: hypothetical protein KBA26_08940 [Candidatus Delongbacteria bacterium]|nr:hypothetical protein [Candidatus Delongbacteria bacterium]
MWIIEALSHYQHSAVLCNLVSLCICLFQTLFVGLIVVLVVGMVMGIRQLLQ